MAHAHERRGFTLIELLIVFAIMAILAGTSLVGALQARLTAYRIQCVSNLHSIGLATQNYVSGTNEFPTGQAKGKTFYYTLRAEIGAEKNTGNSPVREYLCPGRHTASSVAGAPADFGYDPTSILAQKKAVNPLAITDGEDNTLYLSHVAMKPSQYEAGGEQWATGKFQQTQDTNYLDEDPKNPGTGFSSPHPTGIPHLFASSAVRILLYSPQDPNLKTGKDGAWDYKRTKNLPPLGQ